MKFIQPIITINGQLHVHSAIFENLEAAMKFIALNTAYTWFSYQIIEVKDVE